MNGGSLLGAGAFPVAEFLSVQVHEYGHYQNLAHTIVNGQIIVGPDSTGPSPFDTFPLPPSFIGRIETMYPFLFINGGQATPHADDIAIFSTLYPEPTFATTTGSITGKIVAPNNTTPLTGVNVIARNIANPYDDAVSAISSDFAVNYASGSPFVGVYTLRGLTPNASYAVYVDEILDRRLQHATAHSCPGWRSSSTVRPSRTIRSPIRRGMPSRPSSRSRASRRPTSTSSSTGFCPVRFQLETIRPPSSSRTSASSSADSATNRCSSTPTAA